MTAEPLIFKTKEEELQASQAFNKLQMGRRGGGRGLAKPFFPSSASFSTSRNYSSAPHLSLWVYVYRMYIKQNASRSIDEFPKRGTLKTKECLHFRLQRRMFNY